MISWILEAAIIAVVLFSVGAMLKGGLNNFVNKDRIVSVKGLAEMEVPADKVVWPLVYKDIGNDPALLYANMEQKNATIVGYLESNGIGKEEISIAPPEVIDMQAERYGDRNVAYRYNATSVITVTSKNVDKVRKLMSGQAELLKQGIAITGGDYRYNVSYEFTGLNEIKPKMIEDATKNARAAAEKFAKDSDSELGKIRNASQGQFSISDRDAYTPYIKSVRVVTTVNYYLKK
ncbi:SIMPL domain-containing protein [Bacteroides rodentium]